jgi:DNA-binding LytR/AlgR family response regulator
MVTSTTASPTALVADDEPLLRERLVGLLGRLWPQLRVVAQARHGREAIELFERHRPDIAFLDIRMPGQSGLDAAQHIARRAQIVFVTAYQQHAVQAFEQGALDYLVKPFEEARLADTVQRLQQRLREAAHGADASPAHDARVDDIIAAVRAHLASPSRANDTAADASPAPAGAKEPLRWLRASSGATVRLIPVDEVRYFQADEKYTIVSWQGGEAVIRKSIRELVEELDPTSFAQIHRATIVNLREVSHVTRGANETAQLHLKNCADVLSVSRSYLHLFRQM